MASPSSTSSSDPGSGAGRRARRWLRRALQPGFLAIALFLVFDRAIGSEAVLGWLEPRLEASHRAGFVVRLEQRLAALRPRPGPGLHVAVLGNSRALAAIDPEALHAGHVDMIARPGFEVFQQRTQAEAIAAAHPDVAILTWSEFDSHRPVRLEPVVGHAVGGFAALADLVAATDAGFVFRNRDSLLRAGLASALVSYRYRQVLGEALGFAWRRFEVPTRIAAATPPQLAGRSRIALWDDPPAPVPEPLRQRVRELFPTAQAFVAGDQVDMIAEVEPGRHAEVQEALLRDIVETLDAAGARVVVIETPLHPLAQGLYSDAARDAFRAFAAGLERTGEIEFVPLSSMQPFGSSDFLDLMHLNLRGRAKLMRAANGALDAIAREESEAAERSGDPEVLGPESRAGAQRLEDDPRP